MPRILHRASITIIAVALSMLFTGSSIGGATTVPAGPGSGKPTFPNGTVTGNGEPGIERHGSYGGEPVFPRPGGGPRAIHTYSDYRAPDRSYLLDTATGEYRLLPYYRILISPDERMVAVEDIDGRIGVADRVALLGGADAVHWTDLPAGGLSGWSPDGAALLVNTINKETRLVTAHRYDLATDQIRSTLITVDCGLDCTVGWAEDSNRYVVRVGHGPDPQLPIGPMYYLNPDGTLGPPVGTDGHIWSADAYSPSRRYVIVEPRRPLLPGETGEWTWPKVLDLQTRTVVSKIRTEQALIGWYDESHVVRVAPSFEWGAPIIFEVVDIHTASVTKRVVATRLKLPCCYQLGSTTQLVGDAAELGF